MSLIKKKKLTNQPRRRPNEISQNRAAYASYVERRAPATPSQKKSSTQRSRRSIDDTNDRGEQTKKRNESLQRVLRKRKVYYLFVAFVGLLLAFNALYVNTSPNIAFTDIPADTPLLRDKKTYQTAASRILASSPANHFKPTIDSQGLEESLKRQFPELRSVDLSIPVLGFTPTIVVTPSAPTVVLQTISSGSFVLDSSGYAIGESSAIKDLKLLTLVDQTGLKVARGDRAVPRSTMDLVSKLNEQLTAQGIVIESLILPSGSAAQLNVKTAGNNYVVKLSTLSATSYEQQIGSYLAMRSYLTSKGIQPSEYVDVRINGRAYYK